MASSKHAMISMMIFAAFVAPGALAMDYTVGDSSGWRLGFNYTEWAKGKNFHVGDTLMFMYNATLHNVAKASLTDFQQCTSTNASNQFTTGMDTFTLATPGKKWYICSIGNHCTRGMKLSINVVSEGPTPSPSSATTNYSTSKYSVFLLTMVAVIKLMMG